MHTHESEKCANDEALQLPKICNNCRQIKDKGGLELA
jgi:hypothetical protein